MRVYLHDVWVAAEAGKIPGFRIEQLACAVAHVRQHFDRNLATQSGVSAMQNCAEPAASQVLDVLKGALGGARRAGECVTMMVVPSAVKLFTHLKAVL